MLLRKAIQKTKIFFHKTIQKLNLFLLREYQKLPKPRSPNTLYSSQGNNSDMHHSDQFYEGFSEPRDEVMKSKKTAMSTKELIMNQEDDCSGMVRKLEEQSANRCEERAREGKKTGSFYEGKGQPCFEKANGGGNLLAQKMKELEMMDINDMEHVLDIEEVLHYYSRLKCPAYLDIVNQFFMDMYSEFFLPQPSVSIRNSSRRLGPLKL